jgi:hypothetical protein
VCRADEAAANDMTDRDVDKLIVVTSAKKGAKQALDQQLIDDGLALYQEQLSEVRRYFVTSLLLCYSCGTAERSSGCHAFIIGLPCF